MTAVTLFLIQPLTLTEDISHHTKLQIHCYHHMLYLIKVTVFGSCKSSFKTLTLPSKTLSSFSEISIIKCLSLSLAFVLDYFQQQINPHLGKQQHKKHAAGSITNDRKDANRTVIRDTSLPDNLNSFYTRFNQHNRDILLKAPCNPEVTAFIFA